MTQFFPTYKDYFDKLQDFQNLDFYDEVDIKDFSYDPKTQRLTYPCPCGDLFEIYKEDLLNHEDVARCPSCSLIVKIVYEEEDLFNL
ncbi:DPH3-like protein [Vairimorpha necatrix]|uniref:Diphthamide biosynthesis protein 3 n=1 Tax=Vairimorpha necatrix TaxID=6039 RepID=A0AAX4JC10_9MICR